MLLRFFRSETTPVMPLALCRAASSSMRLTAAWRPSEISCVMEVSSPPAMVWKPVDRLRTKPSE